MKVYFRQKKIDEIPSSVIDTVPSRNQMEPNSSHRRKCRAETARAANGKEKRNPTFKRHLPQISHIRGRRTPDSKIWRGSGNATHHWLVRHDYKIQILGQKQTIPLRRKCIGVPQIGLTVRHLWKSHLVENLIGQWLWGAAKQTVGENIVCSMNVDFWSCDITKSIQVTYCCYIQKWTQHCKKRIKNTS